MSLSIEVGDLFNNVVGKDVIVIHGCNAKGVMGSGFAALVKKHYAYAYLAYSQVHRRHGLRLGQVVMAPPIDGNPNPTFANAITQYNYGRDGKCYVDYDAVVVSLQAIAKAVGDKPIHLPMIGGGLGGGDVKRLTAIFQAVFHASNATLWLKED